MVDESLPVVEASEPLQLDKAETLEGHGVASCIGCKKAITDAYFELNGHIVCPACHAGAMAARAGGSGARRFARALFWGGLGAVAGAAVWITVTKLTGWSIGLVAIVVGFLVGKGVRKGSDARGGWVYQTLAVFLTYTAIVSTYVPDIVDALKQNSKAATTTSATVASPAETPSGGSVDPDVGQALGGLPPMIALPLALVIYVAVIGGIAYAAPFFGGFENIIGILIIGFALYEAWKINKRVKLEISGPFQLSAQPAAGAQRFGSMNP